MRSIPSPALPSETPPFSAPPSRPEVVVVGAGAAGIAASRELRAAGVQHLVVEARTRIGGRSRTVDLGQGLDDIDLGCEWLHSADENVLAGMAPALGFSLDRSVPPWRQRHVQRGFGVEEQDMFRGEADAFYERIEAAASGVDRPASDFLDPSARWNGLIDAVSTYYNGAPLSRVSVLDFHRYRDTEVDWRVNGGYGAMIAAAGEGMPVVLGRRVTRIDGTGRALRIETDDGAIETDAVIVTVPTAVLRGIRFDPALDGHLAAADGLPLGIANKLFLSMDDAEGFAPDARIIGDPARVDTGSYTIRPRGRPIVEGYFGGDYARHLERGGGAAFLDAARRELSAALGHDVGATLRLLAATAWGGDPCAGGSYSHALPGCADARRALAEPVDGRIVFAGEATSARFFSTAHGAFEEGTNAARMLIDARPGVSRTRAASSRP